MNSLGFPTYSSCKNGWRYIGKTLLFTRFSLTAGVHSEKIKSFAGPLFAERVKFAAPYLKQGALVSAIFTCGDLTSVPGKLIKAVQVGDLEGIFLSALSGITMSADVIDSLAAWFNASLELRNMDTIPFLSSIGFPLGVTMNVLGTISRTIQVARSHGFYQEIQSTPINEINALLENKFGVTDTIFEVKSENGKKKTHHILSRDRTEIMERIASPDIVKDLYTFYDNIRSDDFNRMENAISSLRGLKAKFRKKIYGDYITLGANMITSSALCFFALGAISAVPFSLLAASMFVRLINEVFQDFYKV